MNTKPKRPEELKFQRTITSQGAGTFDDLKQDYDEFKRLGKVTMVRRAITRQKYKEVHD